MFWSADSWFKIADQWVPRICNLPLWWAVHRVQVTDNPPDHSYSCYDQLLVSFFAADFAPFFRRIIRYFYLLNTCHCFFWHPVISWLALYSAWTSYTGNTSGSTTSHFILGGGGGGIDHRRNLRGFQEACYGRLGYFYAAIFPCIHSGKWGTRPDQPWCSVMMRRSVVSVSPKSLSTHFRHGVLHGFLVHC